MARLTLARKIAAITLVIWKKAGSEERPRFCQKDNSRRKSRVVLSMAAKIGHQIVALKYPPVNSFDQFRIDTSPDCHREGRIAKTRCADMRSSEEQVGKWRYTRRP